MDETGINCNYFYKRLVMTDINYYNQFENSNICWEIYVLITPFSAQRPESYFSGKILERKTIFPPPQVNK